MGVIGSRRKFSARRGVVGLVGAALALGMLGAAGAESAAAASGTDPATGTVIQTIEGTGSQQSQRANDLTTSAPESVVVAPDGSTHVTLHSTSTAPAGLSPTVDVPDEQIRVSVKMHTRNTLCVGVIGAATGWTADGCWAIDPDTQDLVLPVPGGDRYRIWAYELDEVAGKYTDYLFWNPSGADSRLRSNAKAYTPSPLSVPWQNIAPANFRLDLQPWLGTNDSTALSLTSSVYPLYVGAVTTLTATFTGDSGTPSGIVEFWDNEGTFLGDKVLVGGVASIQYTVTHGAAPLFEVDHRGDATYAPLYWEFGGDFLPSIHTMSPGYGATAGGTSVTITGYPLADVTEVTFGGEPGTELNVVDNTLLTVVTPEGADVTAPVVLHTATESSHWDASQFFAFTDSSVVAGIPSGIADVRSFKPGAVRCYQVTGKAGVPVDAVGVTLNVTASLPNAAGHVRVYPDYMNNGASPAPLVSTVNFEVNRDVANSTTIALPDDGKVCVYSVGGTMSRMILDVLGYTLPGSGMELVTPEKLIDTRSAPQYHVGPFTGPVQPMTDYKVQVAGVGSVPVGAKAVMVNITVVDTNFPGHLRMWASDQEMPNTSVVNYAPETKANSQIVALSADGELSFRSFSWVPTTMSPVQVLIDVTGYITAGSDFTATTPTTVVETRPAYTPVGLPAGALTQNTVYPLTLDTSVVPAGATAVVLNVTVVQPTNFGHIRVYPDTNGLGTTTPPIMSNINFIPGRDIPNMVIVQLPEGRTIDFYTAYSGSGQTNLKVDLIGYIGGSPA